MRVIGGKFGGQVLSSFRADHIRPTTDRVKESLFNTWQFEVAGARVLDLFSGTGNLGIEALSRDAELVTFVDAHPQSISVLKKNLEKLRITSGYKVVKSDVLKFLKSNQLPFDLVLIDPPFTEKMAHTVLSAVASSALVKSPGRLAIESVRGERLEDEYGVIVRTHFKEFGDKFLSHYQWGMA